MCQVQTKGAETEGRNEVSVHVVEVRLSTGLEDCSQTLGEPFTPGGKEVQEAGDVTGHLAEIMKLAVVASISLARETFAQPLVWERVLLRRVHCPLQQLEVRQEVHSLRELM